jgi:hypothetical protein
MSEIRHDGTRCRQRQARFANSANSNQRDDALLADLLGNPASVVIAPDERGERLGHVMTADARRALHQRLASASMQSAKIWVETG